MSNEKNENFPTSFIAGVVIGAVLTYLFTTETGKKIKKELLKDATRALENVGDELEDAEEKAKAELNLVKKELGQKKEEVEKKVQATKEEITKKVDQAQKAIEQRVQEVKQEVKEVVREEPKQVDQVQGQINPVQKKRRHFFFSRKHRSES